MRIPKEKETRIFFRRLGCELAPVDASRGEHAVSLALLSLGAGAFDVAPNLATLWEKWANLALYYQRQNDRVCVVVENWINGNRRTRQAIERWVECGGRTPWETRFAILAKALPSTHYSPQNMPRGWKRRLVRDYQIAIEDPRKYFEKVRDGLLIAEQKLDRATV